MIVTRSITHPVAVEEIIEAREAGTLESVLPSGANVKASLGDDEITFDVARDSKRTFLVLHDAMPEPHCMNDEWTNKGGWPASEMRRHVLEVFEQFPVEFKELAVPIKIKQTCRGEVVESEDTAFLLSASQVFGYEWLKERDCGDEQLDIFADPRNRVKFRRGASSAWWWWLRSAIDSSSFYGVLSDGSDITYRANHEGGVVVGFCIESRDLEI